MSNEYFVPSGSPSTASSAASSVMRSEFNLIEDGFDKLPVLSTSASKFWSTNSGGTAVEAATTVTTAAKSVLDDASVAAMRVTLDVPSNAEAILDTLIAAKGDIIVGTANDTPAVLTVGTDTKVLVANSATASGLEWQAPVAAPGMVTAESYFMATF